MKLRGKSVKALVGMGHVTTPVLYAARKILAGKGKALELMLDLFEALPKSTKQGDETYTKDYRGLRALILDRTGIDWHKGQLSAALKILTKFGLVRRTADGDLVIVYEAFEKQGLYTDRKDREQAAKKTMPPKQDAAPKEAASKALAKSTAPVVNINPQEVSAAKASDPCDPYDAYVTTARDWELRPTSRVNFEGNPETYLDLQQTEIDVRKKEGFVPLSQRTQADVLVDLF